MAIAVSGSCSSASRRTALLYGYTVCFVCCNVPGFVSCPGRVFCPLCVCGADISRSGISRSHSCTRYRRRLPFFYNEYGRTFPFPCVYGRAVTFSRRAVCTADALFVKVVPFSLSGICLKSFCAGNVIRRGRPCLRPAMGIPSLPDASTFNAPLSAGRADVGISFFYQKIIASVIAFKGFIFGPFVGAVCTADALFIKVVPVKTGLFTFQTRSVSWGALCALPMPPVIFPDLICVALFRVTCFYFFL